MCWSRSAARHDRRASRSATISKQCSPIWKRGCARPPPTELRGSRAPARRSQAPARHRARGGRRSHRQAAQRAGKAGAYAGTKKYGDAANLPVSAIRKKTVSSALKASGVASSSGSKCTSRISTRCTARSDRPIARNRACPQSRSAVRAGSSSRRICGSRGRVGPAPRSTGREAGAAGWVEEEVSDAVSSALVAARDFRCAIAHQPLCAAPE